MRIEALVNRNVTPPGVGVLVRKAACVHVTHYRGQLKSFFLLIKTQCAENSAVVQAHLHLKSHTDAKVKVRGPNVWPLLLRIKIWPPGAFG